jgi:hypothetical protein
LVGEFEHASLGGVFFHSQQFLLVSVYDVLSMFPSLEAHSASDHETFKVNEINNWSEESKPARSIHRQSFPFRFVLIVLKERGRAIDYLSISQRVKGSSWLG